MRLDPVYLERMLSSIRFHGSRVSIAPILWRVTVEIVIVFTVGRYLHLRTQVLVRSPLLGTGGVGSTGWEHSADESAITHSNHSGRQSHGILTTAEVPLLHDSITVPGLVGPILCDDWIFDLKWRQLFATAVPFRLLPLVANSLVILSELLVPITSQGALVSRSCVLNCVTIEDTWGEIRSLVRSVPEAEETLRPRFSVDVTVVGRTLLDKVLRTL